MVTQKKLSPLFLLQIDVDAELELRRRNGDPELVPPDGWRDWLRALFPRYVVAPFALRHEEFWEWIDSIELTTEPLPFIALWPRGGAKSTSAELGVVHVAAKKTRRYVWYVSSTQDKADGHVDNIGSMMESEGIEKYYPELSQRMLGKYGNSKGWRRSRLRAASGFTVDALGLDTGARGVKIEEQRPDMIILDDIDEVNDSFTTTAKKIDTITKTILPSGANGNCAVLFIQNLIHPDSIASQLADGRAEFLANRNISGPFPAIEGLTYAQVDKRFMITGGTATWEGQNLKICQLQIDKWGLTSFLQEANHDVDRTGGKWDHIEFQHIEWDEVPDLVRIVLWIDPAVTSTDKSDSMGISAGGVDTKGKVYNLYAWEGITSPEDALERGIRKGIELGAEHIGIETDQGGDTWESVYKRAAEKIISEMREEWKRDHLNEDLSKMPTIRIPPFTSDKVARLSNDVGNGKDSKSKDARNSIPLRMPRSSASSGEVIPSHA